jgi:uncharacterized damage-inducible protein DinB
LKKINIPFVLSPISQPAMYRNVDDFKNDWKNESEATLKVLKNLTDDSLGQRVSAGGRSLGFLAWHLVTGLDAMAKTAGLKLDVPAHDAPVPNADGIVAGYEKAAHSLEKDVQNGWNDSTLEEEFDMFGQKMQKGKLLSSLILHQAHHRGQLTVLMRQAGLRVPGVYGPAKEEWEAMGIPAMK